MTSTKVVLSVDLPTGWSFVGFIPICFRMEAPRGGPCTKQIAELVNFWMRAEGIEHGSPLYLAEKHDIAFWRGAESFTEGDFVEVLQRLINLPIKVRERRNGSYETILFQPAPA